MNQTLGSVLPHAAAKYGDKTALVFRERSFGFRELDAMTSRFASGLARLGIAAGDRVTLYAGNSWEWVVAYYGIAKLGAVVNPISAMLTPPEVVFVTGNCGARAIVAAADKGAALRSIRTQMPVEQVVLFGDAAPEGMQRFADVLASGDARFVPAEVAPDALCTIGYTSGTTGHPKGAMLCHRNILTSAALTATMHVRTAADTVVSALPCSHVYGNMVMQAAFVYGMTFVLIAKFDEKEVLQAIQTHRATLFEGVPTMFMLLLAHPELSRYDVSSLTRCTVGGQTMPVAKTREFESRFGCPLLELWGMTEVGGAAVTHAWYAVNRHGSIGVALPGTGCRIAAVDDASCTLAPGEVGELMVRGPLVMQGYWGNEQATRETIEKDGWMHTGDLARSDEDGYLYVVDRKKDMIITGGYNVYPAELERVIAAHPAVAMVAVGPRPDALKGEIAKAYVVPKPGASATSDEIVAFCRESLAAYKVPRDVMFVPDLPKTSTGKVMRRELKTLDR